MATTGSTGGAGGSGGGFTALSLSEQLPRILDSGGPTLKTPVVVPVYFVGESAAKIALIDAFLAKLGGSAYWAATTSEYGVGPLTAAAPITLAETAPATVDDASLKAWLVSALETGKLPQPTAGSIYALYYPSGTSVIGKNGAISCKDYGAYHGEVAFNGQSVAFTAMPHCDAYSAHLVPGESIAGDELLTGLSSHELVEAVTDPAFFTAPAFQVMDDLHLAYRLYLIGGETGDSCEQQPGAFYLDPALGFAVQRSWSNAAAAAGHDPCVPSDSPYTGAFPRMPLVKVQSKMRQAIKIPLGGTATVPVDLVSEDPASDAWTVTPLDYKGIWGGPTRLELSLDKTTGKNGDVLMLTIHALSFDSLNRAGFLLESKHGTKRTRIAGLVIKG
jgi:hypothetical protein